MHKTFLLQHWHYNLALSFVIIVWVVSFFETGVMPDSGYTLPTARLLSEGYQPFQDLLLQHTTSVLYLFASLYYFYPEANYLVCLGIQYSAIAGVLFFTALFLKETSVDRSFIAWILVYAAAVFYIAEGAGINLEPYVLVPGLAAQWLILKIKPTDDRVRPGLCILCGVLAGISFTAKQYGGFILASICLHTFLFSSKNVHRILHPLIVGAFFFLTVMSYWLLLASFRIEMIEAVWSSFFGAWYESYYHQFPIFLVNALSYAPYLLLLPFYFYEGKKFRDPIKVMVLVSLCLTFSQGLVRSYPHYFQHCIPYCCIVLGAILQKNIGSRTLRRYFIKGTVFLSLFLLVLQFRVLTLVYPRNLQSNVATVINMYVPKNSSALMLASPAYSYLAELHPAHDTKQGFNFLHNFSPTQLLEIARNADYIVTMPFDIYYYHPIIEIFERGDLNLENDVIKGRFDLILTKKSSAGLTVLQIFKRQQ